MARNRKHQSAAVHLAPAVKVLFLCSFVVAAGVGYVCQKDQLVNLGQRKATLERRLRLLREQSQQIEGKLIWLQSPGALEAKVREFKLGLSRVDSDKIIPLVEPSSSAMTRMIVEAPARTVQRDRGLKHGGLAER